jgi:hypothetical protein
MDLAIANALKRKREIELEIAKIDQFIEAYELFSGTKVVQDEMISPPDPVENKSAMKGSLTVSRVRNSPARIADIAARVILDAGRPLARGELVERIEKHGITIKSDDKPRYVGTILWRNAHRFMNIEGEGYWLKDRPIPSEQGKLGDVFE